MIIKNKLSSKKLSRTANRFIPKNRDVRNSNNSSGTKNTISLNEELFDDIFNKILNYLKKNKNKDLQLGSFIQTIDNLIDQHLKKRKDETTDKNEIARLVIQKLLSQKIIQSPLLQTLIVSEQKTLEEIKKISYVKVNANTPSKCSKLSLEEQKEKEKETDLLTLMVLKLCKDHLSKDKTKFVKFEQLNKLMVNIICHYKNHGYSKQIQLLQKNKGNGNIVETLTGIIESLELVTTKSEGFSLNSSKALKVLRENSTDVNLLKKTITDILK